jgi:hypothetical protein
VTPDLSQVDVPPRQSYIVAVVDPDERSAAAGITAIARSIGSAPAPAIAAPLLGTTGLASLPFVLGGVLKITYDLLLYRLFRALRPPEELPRREPPRNCPCSRPQAMSR